MGKVIFSCGHEDFHRPLSGWPLTTKDYDTFEGDLEKSITYRHVCLDCYIKYIGTYPECVVFDEAEQDEWFNSEDDEVKPYQPKDWLGTKSLEGYNG